MVAAHDQGMLGRRLAQIVNSDFCPWANGYVYWLKEPVGWFVLAMMASVLVGLFVSPMGWSLAVGLLSLITLGLVFPWLATRCVLCRLRPVNDVLHERQELEFELSVRNYLPVPVVGLVLERFFDAVDVPAAGGTLAVVQAPGRRLLVDSGSGIGLERVPALCSATFRLSVRPEYRGLHPQLSPKLACAFPLGIWTARRDVCDFTQLHVLPLVIPISEELQLPGRQLAEVGCGERATDHGDFIGVRDFRRGDSLKSIHWAQSARLDQLVICERGGPQKQTVQLRLETWPGQGEPDEIRENLAWRVRIAAGLVELLAARHLSFELFIDGHRLPLAAGAASRMQVLRELAVIPLDGPADTRPAISRTAMPQRPSGGATWICISSVASDGSLLPSGLIRITARLERGGFREPDLSGCLIDLDRSIGGQLNHWLMELGHANRAA